MDTPIIFVIKYLQFQLPNDHSVLSCNFWYSRTPHEWPPAFYDRFFTDRMSPLYKRPLTNDHPADATNDHGNSNFTPNKRPSDRWTAQFLT